MRHDKVMRTRKDLPNHIVLAAHKRKAIALIALHVDNLIVLREQDHRRARLSARKKPPAIMLVRQGRVSNRGHERGDEAGVVKGHPSDIHEHMLLKGNGGTVGFLRLTGAGSLCDGDVGGCCGRGDLFGLSGGRDGLLQANSGQVGEDSLRHEARLEDEQRHGAKVFSVDEASGGEQDERRDNVRKRSGKVNSNASTERVSNKAESVISSPGKRA